MVLDSPLLEFKPWQGEEAYKKAWDFLDLCLIENAKSYHRVKEAGKEPSYWQEKAVKLFARRDAMDKARAKLKADKKKAAAASQAAKEGAECAMGLRMRAGVVVWCTPTWDSLLHTEPPRRPLL